MGDELREFRRNQARTARRRALFLIPIGSVSFLFSVVVMATGSATGRGARPLLTTLVLGGLFVLLGAWQIYRAIKLSD